MPTIAACFALSGPVQVAWSVSPSLATTLNNSLLLTLDLTSLPLATYTFSANATAASQTVGVQWATASVAVVVAALPPVAVLTPNVLYRSADVNQPLVLDAATASYDPSYPSAPLNCTWICSSTAAGTCPSIQ